MWQNTILHKLSYERLTCFQIKNIFLNEILNKKGFHLFKYYFLNKIKS